MTRIIRGVLNFQRRVFGGKRELFQQLGKGQKPLALFITCSDSRVAPDLLAQTEPGELFVLRNAGNIVPPHGGAPGPRQPPWNTPLCNCVSARSFCAAIPSAERCMAC